MMGQGQNDIDDCGSHTRNMYRLGMARGRELQASEDKVELDALRAKVVRLLESSTNKCDSCACGIADQRDQLRAENEQLRLALDKIFEAVELAKRYLEVADNGN